MMNNILRVFTVLVGIVPISIGFDTTMSLHVKNPLSCFCYKCSQGLHRPSFNIRRNPLVAGNRLEPSLAISVRIANSGTFAYIPSYSHSTHRRCLQSSRFSFGPTGSGILKPSLSASDSEASSGTHIYPKKMRVSDLLVQQGLATDIKHAAALIMAGSVIAHESTVVESPAQKLSVDTSLRLRGQKRHRWVSRGGLKLEHAIKHFNLSFQGQIAVDIGCSTGGFTHVLLESGIARVYAVDVGYGQLALPLRQDPRVVVLERTNARNLTKEIIPEVPTVIVCDASFIPLHKVLPAALSLCSIQGSHLLALIKPQFEAQRDEIESGTGVVRSDEVRDRICGEVVAWVDALEERQGRKWRAEGVTESPIKGPNGNTEFILHARLE